MSATDEFFQDGEMVDPTTGEVMLTKAQLEAVMIDDLAIDEEMMRAPTDMAFWNARYGECLRKFLLDKHEYKATEGRRRLEIKASVTEKRLEFLGHVIEKPTDEDYKAAVAADPDVEEAMVRLAQSHAEMEKTKGFRDAVSAKKDMTQSLGAKLREEMRGDGALRAHHRDSRNATLDDDNDD